MKSSKKQSKNNHAIKIWFGVKTLYLTYEKVKKRQIPVVCEERVTLFKAKNFDEAIRLAEIEAKKYAAGTFKNASGNQVQTCYIKACDAFKIFESKIDQGIEVYSHMKVVSPRTTKTNLKKLNFGSAKITRNLKKGE